MKRNLVFFYWLLLMVATLAIGGVTFYLLQRENERLRGVASDNAVRSGQTIASNLNSLINHAKTDSMDELDKFSETGIVAQILGGKEMLKDSFPFARTVFYFVPGVGLEFPRPNTPDHRFLLPFVQNRLGWIWDPPNRFLQHYLASNFQGTLRSGNNGPMKGAPPALSANVSGGNVVSSGGNPGFSSGNIGLGGDGQNLNIVPDDSSLNLPANTGVDLPQIVIQFPNGKSIDISRAFSDNFTQNFANAAWQGLPPNAITSEVEDTVSKVVGAGSGQTQIISSQQTLTVVTSSNPLASAPHPEQGWVPVGRRDDYHWLGWMRETPASPVRGVLLSWDLLEKSMGAAFPDKLSLAEGFILRDPAGKAVIARFANGAMLVDNQSNAPVDKPDVRVNPAFKPVILPIAASTEMPGWSLEVYFNPGAKFSSNFMALSTVLVTVLVISVLVGGTLLMHEARREAFDAARKTSFVSNVSHELKTPLTTIRMYAELLGEGRVRDHVKQGVYLTTIINESQRLTRLVNNVLDFGRLEQGRKQYHPANVSLAEVVRSVLEAQRPRLEEAGFRIETDLAPAADFHIHTDRDALEQVLLNLIDNALKYATDGHWLGVRISHDAEHALLTVSDHGPGVPAGERERIFEIFHRVDDSITVRMPGAGLGLSIARRLLRDQEGDLYYVPNAPCGASFVASLPLAVSAEKTASAPV